MMRKEKRKKEGENIGIKDKRRGYIRVIKILVLLSALYGESAALTLPAYASTGIKSVRVWIGVEGYDEMQEPIIEAEAKGSGYEVESIALTEGMPARGPAARTDGGELTAEEETQEGQIIPKIGEMTVAQEISKRQRGSEEPEYPSDYRCEIELLADDACHFSIMERSDIKLSGVKGECTKAVRKNGGSSLVLSVRLTGLGEILGEIDRAELSADGHAVWGESVHAVSYRIQLYQGGERTGLSHRTEQTEFDFSPLMTEAGTYYYKVTPLSEKGKKGQAMESFPVRLERESAEDNRARWPFSGYGWQQGDTVSYRYSDGLYPQRTWLELDNIQYYFDRNGAVVLN